MAFDKAPYIWFPGYDFSNTGGHNYLLLTTNESGGEVSLPRLSDADADDQTGDVRVVAWAILDALWTKWNSLPAADRPTQMAINHTQQINQNSDGTLSIRHNYNFTFLTEADAITNEEVAAEPESES